MRFSPSLLDDIKARLPVSEVVGRRVKLQKAGREWKGLSPFNAEKTPSFTVNDQKGFFHDFSSGKHGNIFDFVMETEGLSFPEAVERLAAQAGVPLPAATPESEAREKQRAGLHEVLELAAAFFEASLQSRDGATARGYLSDRGLGPALQREFRLGYAPDLKFALRDHLAQKGASAATMIEAGLLIHGEDIQVPYDRFRGRVMFPIADRAGRIIAFGGRALSPDVPAKYLNSPETPLFHKGAILYNHHRARTAAHDRGTVIAVEGYVDVIAMTVAGFPNSVAPLGTALTGDQCGLLWRMAPEPILCFDGDKAGRKAAYRAIDVALPLIGPERTLRFAMLPDGQDPDDLVRAGGGATIAEIVDGARPLVDMLWTREVEAAPLDTPERRAALERRLAETLKTIADEPIRRYYQAEMQARLAALLGGGGRQSAVGNRQSAAGRRPWGSPTAYSRLPTAARPPRRGYMSEPLVVGAALSQTPRFRAGAGFPAREARILLVLMNHPALLHRHAEELASTDFAHRDLARLRDALVTAAARPIDDHRQLRDAVDALGVRPIRERIDAAAPQIACWSDAPEAADIDAESALGQALTLHRKTRALHSELRSAEIQLAGDGNEANLARLQQILSELATMDGMEATVDGFGAFSGRGGGES